MIQLYNEDCLKGMKTRLKKNSVDLIVTSPPYNIGIKYNEYNDYIPRNEYLHFMRDISHKFNKVLSDNGSIFLNVGTKPSDQIIPFDVLNVFVPDFKLQNTFHWIKHIHIDSINQSFGHFKPINSKRYENNCHEYIFHLTKRGDVELNKLALGVEYQDKSNIKRWKNTNNGLRSRGNTWQIPYKTINNRKTDRPHPASFPIDLPKYCMLIHGVDKIKLAIDPFLGIGSSALAAQELGLNFVGFEIDEFYFNIAENKLKLK
jgi:site-specific DNA-methyltransferase (adenine-specific)